MLSDLTTVMQCHEFGIYDLSYNWNHVIKPFVVRLVIHCVVVTHVCAENFASLPAKFRVFGRQIFDSSTEVTTKGLV